MISVVDCDIERIAIMDNFDNLIKEFKHSVRMHLNIMGGPSQQLSVFLLKLIDIIEDSDINRRNKDLCNLSFCIVEGLALYIQRFIDTHAEKLDNHNNSLRQASDNILIMVGKTRSLDDKISSKYAILKVLSDALRVLSTYTKATYPSFTDLDGNVL